MPFKSFKVTFAGCAVAGFASALTLLQACVPSVGEPSSSTSSAPLQSTTLVPSMDIGENPTVTSDTYPAPDLWKNVAQDPTSANDAHDVRNQWAQYASASYTAGFSGAPSGAVSALTVNYRAKVDHSGKIQVFVYDAGTLIATGPQRSLTRHFANYSESFPALSASSANNLQVKVVLAMTKPQYAYVSAIQIAPTLEASAPDAGSSGGSSSGSSSGSSISCNLIRDTSSYSAPAVAKPGYLQPYTDPVFGTKITRVTGDPGTAIPSGGTWGTDVHHEYSKVQAWNADQSLVFIETNRENGGSGSVFLDGRTFQPVFSHSCPGSECRWHPTDPTTMVYAGGNQIGTWYPRTNTTSVLATLSGYSGLGIGPWEGNLSLDGSKVVVNGIDPFGKVIVFAYDLVSHVKYPDIAVASLGTTLDWASISPRGDYVVVQVDEDVSFVLDPNGNRVASFLAGHPSHYDMTIDQNGDEVAVGKAVRTPYDGRVVKVRLKDAQMTPLTTGGYARHSSTRDTKLLGLAVSSFEPDVSPYQAEIGLIDLDGSAVYRLAHHYDRYTDYESEVIPTISPDGLHVLFASNWGSSTGRPVQVYAIDLTGSCTTP